jgi:hypothetical protein
MLSPSKHVGYGYHLFAQVIMNIYIPHILHILDKDNLLQSYCMATGFVRIWFWPVETWLMR